MTVGPADLDVLELSFSAEAKVEAKVARRVVAGAAANLIDPEAGGAVEGDAGTDGIAVGDGSDEVQA